ncbi:RagB/SusD family nutrient uptake outer membrane protein [Carboxylicivirga sp. M1479]|uniref:RagB/SusD family nutrient uptake outer membrane protein n=1 Tax=Carboxylicivirga sp. M1479 TaxID=2594476 RepID=UPI00163D9A44|nr:RagB/SusD family nutrient uptake outer membrane protein [Carboxylicivirga sp. M1479]
MRTNNINKVILGLLVLVGFACSDILDKTPDSNWMVDDFYSDDTEAQLGMAGIYSYLGDKAVYGSDFPTVFDAGSDEGYYNRRYNENWTVALYRHTAADLMVEKLWTQLYACVNASNMFIEKLDKEAFEEDAYNRYIAEARFLRAFAYSQLVSWYGPIPLRLTYSRDQTSNHVAASTEAQVYEQIIKDFTYAYEKLPHAQDADYVPGHANKMAAHGLLARVYLKMAGYPLLDTEKFELAKAHCDSVILDDWHALNVSSDDQGYRDVFMTYIQNTYDLEESIFEISFTNLRDLGLQVGGKVGNINGVAWNYGGEGYPFAYAMLNASPVVKNSYAAEDARAQWNVRAYRNKGGNIDTVKTTMDAAYCPTKFRRWEPTDWSVLNTKPDNGQIESYVVLEPIASPNKNYTGINFPILRYSDVLLMHAEASNEVNGMPTTEGIANLNKVRLRAGLELIEIASPEAIATKEAFLTELQNERLREFCFEGLRKQDLIRWGLLGKRLEFLNATIEGDPNFDAKNEQHVSYMRAGLNYDETKHNTLPYPLQEVSINNLLDQKDNW